MELIYDSVIQMTQQMTQRQTTQPERTSSETDSFRKLMEKQQAAAKSTDSEKPAVQEEQQTDGSPVVSEDAQLQERMALAAIAALQNPVVQQAAEPVVQQQAELPGTAAVSVTGEPAQVPVETGVQTALPVAQQTAESPVPQQQDTAPQTVVQDDAPEAAVKNLTETGPQKTTADTGVREQAVTAAQNTADDSPAAKNGTEQFEQQAEAEVPVFKEVRGTPVKVGEATTMTETAKPVETQIGEKLTEALQQGESRVVIQLEPESLGKVTVELTWNENGALRVGLHAESSQTRSLLERDAAGLQSLLSRNSQQEVQVEVQRQQESQQQNLYEDGRQEKQQQQRQQERRHSDQDFLQQLRLGLIPLDGEAS